MGQAWRELDYRDYGETIKLFNLAPGKLVKECLCDRGNLLQNNIEDADKVETKIEEWNKDQQLTARQERGIVTQCLFLWKSYKIAVQCMNAWTWKECWAERIKSFHHCGINYVGNEETIRRWHIYFCKNKTFPNRLGRSKKLLEPKVFEFFLELKLKIHEFCAYPNNQPSMSSESAAAEIRQNILPKCYEDLLGETNDPGGLLYTANA
jgi:hypothetical protein